MSRTLLLLCAALLLWGCDDDPGNTSSDGDASLTQDTGNTTQPGDTTPPPPPPSTCTAIERVEMTGATEVATDAELRAALESGGPIQLTADITASGPFPVLVPATVDGGGHTISGGDATHLFVVERTEFTLQNITLADAFNQVDDSEHFSRRSGAAIMASGSAGPDIERTGSLTVIDVTFENNRIKSTGPGDLRGGALYAFALPDTRISGATFRNNVGSNGGAIGGLGSSFEIVNSQFIGNRTNGTGPAGALEGHGGAISLDALSQNGKTAYFNICGSTFRDNVAYHGGGAFYLVTHGYTGSEVRVHKTLFENNQAIEGNESGQGGAIFLMDDNKHERPAGGGVPNSALFTESAFIGNQAWSRGAGLWYWTEEGQLTLTNVTFDSNRVTRDGTGMGGGLAVSRGPAVISHCTFSNNWAKFHGGGIQMSGDAVVTLTNSLFYNNTSNRDGGWANFHTNRAVDVDGGGNLQFLDPGLAIDSNSDARVSENATQEQDPLLQPIADNGGPTPTLALDPASPARDAGVDAGLSTDQRGEPRDDGQPDVGAFEL